MLQLGAGHRHEKTAHQMLRAAVARRCVMDRVRRRLGQRDEFLHIARRYLWVDQQHIGRVDQLGNRRKALDRVVGHGLVDPRTDHMCRRHHHQCVAIWRCLGDEVGSDGRSGAGLVLDDELLAHGDRQLLAEDARHHIGETARRKWNNQSHRPVRIALCKSVGQAERQQREHQQRAHGGFVCGVHFIRLCSWALAW